MVRSGVPACAEYASFLKIINYIYLYHLSMDYSFEGPERLAIGYRKQCSSTAQRHSPMEWFLLAKRRVTSG